MCQGYDHGPGCYGMNVQERGNLPSSNESADYRTFTTAREASSKQDYSAG